MTTDAKAESPLGRGQWAVIADHYLNFNLTHADAFAEAKDLVARKQHAVVVTNETARRMIQANTELSVATLPDMKF
jgi:hypothetical protein